MVEIWADEACTIRPDSLAWLRGDSLYFQVNRNFGPGQIVTFAATEEERGNNSSVQVIQSGTEIHCSISINDDRALYEDVGTISEGSVYRLTNLGSPVLNLRSFSIGSIIDNNPAIVPDSIYSVPIYYDQAEQVWLYAIACLNTNGEYVFLEAANNSSKVHVTSQKYDGIPVFAFTPSPLPTIENPSADVPFTFSAAYNRQFGKHAPYTHRLDNVSEIEPGNYDYAISLLVNNTVINSQNLITGDESPLAVPVFKSRV